MQRCFARAAVDGVGAGVWGGKDWGVEGGGGFEEGGELLLQFLFFMLFGGSPETECNDSFADVALDRSSGLRGYVRFAGEEHECHGPAHSGRLWACHPAPVRSLLWRGRRTRGSERRRFSETGVPTSKVS